MLRGLVARACACQGRVLAPREWSTRSFGSVDAKTGPCVASSARAHFFGVSNTNIFRRMSSAVPQAGSGVADPAGIDISAMASDAQLSETMRRVLSLDNASQAEKHQYRMRQVLKEFQLHPSDTGSPEVQIALLTERMAHLADHVKQHRKDHNTKRGLIQIVSDRRCLLKYLKREDEERYQKLIARLGIRDVISLLPPRAFLPAKAALAAAAKTRQRAQTKLQAVKDASKAKAKSEAQAQRRAEEEARRVAADVKYEAKRAAAAAAAAAEKAA